ncbi:MAG: hypothetical protein F4Y28_04490 [Acidimicrobiia bacterium]|nr:hypothetical protein [Acidimicrobiia bacterium]MYG57531.1 hypothetical protein [Acidimicrobiia bacterium]MYJ34291.1 hypothetical protein [Acidimicrobiia bacterium]
MLQPASRITLIDAMRPPVNFCLESAMAVTFILDLRALLAAPAAFAMANQAGTSTDENKQEPIELLHALRTHANEISVFSQAGEIALPPSRRVFAFLENVVIPVAAPLGGVVHPKVWVLRYEAIDDLQSDQRREQRLRVLVASRNLTFDTSWDTVVRLDETTDATGALLEPIGDLFEGLLNAAVGELSTDHQRRVNSLSKSLQTARFALPVGVDQLKTHVLGLTRQPSPLPTSYERSLIVSPFVTDAFFNAVHPGQVDELVSRAESLDSLSLEVLHKASNVYTFDDGSMEHPTTDLERSSPHDPGRPLVGLHAKVFAYEEDGAARLFVGSANATGAAFTKNIEILLELEGPSDALGIDQICNGTEDEFGLRNLFHTYKRDVGDPPPPDPYASDNPRHAIARIRLEGIVEESGDEWAVTYRSQESLPAVQDTEIHCWPLASSGNRRRVTAGEPLEVRFETSLETISGFLAFELVDQSGTLTCFVVPVPLVGVPEHRDRFLMRALVGNAERFLRYLLALLDEDSGQMDLPNAVDGFGKATSDGMGSVNLPVLEKMLRTMRRDPAKIVGLHPLVSDLASDDALPPGFAALWMMIYEAATEYPEAR